MRDDLSIIARSGLLVSFLIFGIAASATSPAYSDQYLDYKPDISDGKESFKKCVACHTVKPEIHFRGPSLHGVMSRKVMSAEGYKYSSSAKTLKGIWTAQRLFTFVRNPRKMLKDTKCFVGFGRHQDAANMVAYLATAR
ncbi:MAG TPA: c-type cytochrome [Sphingorhabdus sp.]|nr:c-type cytochrome [Sphingorhabdus sp.]